tara:strand:+ start:149 stop:1216 length:1068 start_codon:yes stop_codon:yes gene_type:complete
MSLKLPTTVADGLVYCIREQDYLDNSIGRYVKLGLTSRTVAQRIREHQTANPRREMSEYDINVEMMSYAEKYLHHYFAEDRIGGEWFDMDNARVLGEIAPILVTLQTEMAARKSDFVQWGQLKNQVSNGTVRSPSTAETTLHQSYMTAHANWTQATAQHNIHKANLKAMIGTNDGIEDVLTLTEVNASDAFAETTFQGLLTAAQLTSCNETKTTITGQMVLTGGGSLGTLNPALQTQLTNAKNTITTTPNLTNLSGTPLSLTQAIKDEHMLYLATKRQVKETEWECLKVKSQLVVALDLDDSITGVITWRRTSETSTKFSKKLAKENFEVEYNSCLSPVTNTVRINFHEGRKYNP